MQGDTSKDGPFSFDMPVLAPIDSAKDETEAYQGQVSSRGGAENYIYQEQAGPAPAPMTNLSAADHAKYMHIFALMDALGPILEAFDDYAAQNMDVSIPPELITRPWVFPDVIPAPGHVAIRKAWPNYAAMRADYNAAVSDIMSSYQNVTVSGLGQFLTVFITSAIVIVAVAVVVLDYLEVLKKRSPQQLIIESPEFQHLNEPQKNEILKSVNTVAEKTADVAKDNNITLPAAIKAAAGSLWKIAGIALLGFLAWELFRHERP